MKVFAIVTKTHETSGMNSTETHLSLVADSYPYSGGKLLPLCRSKYTAEQVIEKSDILNHGIEIVELDLIQ